MNPPLDLRLLGGADLRHADGTPVHSVLAQPKRFALLCHLALAAPATFLRREQLLALLWPEAEPASARAALRNALYFLRRSLGAEVVEARGAEELRLATGRVRCDAVAFAEALDAGRLEEALEGYAGPLLPGFSVEDAPGWNEWLDRERAALARRAGEAAERLAADAEAAGDLPRAVRWSRRSAELRPDEEEPVRRLMMRLAAAGDRAAARAAYDDLARRTLAAFGDPPSPATQRVLEALREAEPAEPDRPVLRPVEGARPAAVPAAPTRAPRGTRRWWLLSLPAAVLAAAAAALAWSHRPPHPAAAAAWDRVAVLPFQVHGYTRHEYLGAGMVDLLSATLDGAGRLRTADPRAVLAAVPYSEREVTPAEARLAAGRLGARFVVLGSVVASAERLRVSASLYDRAGGDEPVAVARAEGATDDVFRLVDALSIGLLSNRLRDPAERLDRVAARTSGSLPALKLYLRGAGELRAGRYQQAVDLLQQALAADSGFALASYRLAVAADGAGARPALVQEALERAQRHAQRLPERERLFLEAYTRADAAGFRALLERYPDDAEGWYHLGDLAFHALPGEGRPFTDSRDAFLRALANDSLHPGAILHGARIVAWEGNRGALDTLTRRALARWPDGEEALELSAMRALALGDRAAAERTRRGLAAAGDNRAWITLWRAVLNSGEPHRGAELMEALSATARPRGVRAAGFVARGHLALARGRPTEAAAHLAAAERLDPAVAARFRAAVAVYPLVGAGCGGPSAGLDLPDSLPPLDLPTLDAARRGAGRGGAHAGIVARAFVDICRGELAAARAAAERIAARGDHATAALIQAHAALKDGPGAPPTLPRSVPPASGLPEAHARWLAAEHARRAGRHAEAYRLYASIPADLEYANLPYYAPAELRMAELAERLGRPRAAARHRARLAHAWRDAEPSLHALLAPLHPRTAPPPRPE